jgi:lipopolysaccharide transport system permease protein
MHEGPASLTDRAGAATVDTSLPSAFPVTVITPQRGWFQVDWAELWKYRELLFYLTWRDILIRYKQTALGVAWAFLQPLTTTIIFATFLGRAGGLSKDFPNYHLHVLAGILPWTFLSNAVLLAGNSLLTNVNLVTKVFFPRLLIPFSSVGACLFDLAISSVLLIGMLAWNRVLPGVSALFVVPLCLVLIVILALGVGALLSALVVVQRDFRYVLTFGVQLWLFATPTIYMDGSRFSETFRTWVPLNPAYGLIQNFQNAILARPIDWYSLGISAAMTLVLAALGVSFFSKVERDMVDVI